MLEPLGVITESATDGKPAVAPNPATVNPNANGAGKPEVIVGYETYDPGTEKFTAGGTDTGNVKLTKDGRIDGRSIRSGRRKSAGNDATKEKVDVSSFSFGDLLVGIHGFLAGMTGVEQLEISKDEGAKQGEALQTLAKEYGHQVNPKVAAWINLGVVCAGIYGPRYGAWKLEQHAKRVEAATPKKTEPEPEPIYAPMPDTFSMGAE